MPAMDNSATEPVKPDAREVRRAVICSTVGNTMEAYDFLIYALMASLVFPEVFFPQEDHLAGVLFSFSTFFVAFLARPLGAVIFGHLGDRVGRKVSLLTTVIMMGIGTVGVGLVPSYDSIGPACTVILVFLRIVGGIALGGEWTGANLLALESAPANKAGFLTGFAQAASPFGLAMSAGAILIVNSTMSEDTLKAWGWRLPFLISAGLVVLGLWMRLKVRETPEFRKLQAEGEVSRQPLRDVLRHQRHELVTCIALKFGEMITYYLLTVFLLSYGKDKLGYSSDLLLISVAVAALAAGAAMPLFGRLGDRVGHVRVFRASALVMAVAVMGYFPLLAMGNDAIALPLITIGLVLYSPMFAVQGMILSTVFNPAWRYSGGALAFNFTGVIAAGPAPIVATLAEEAGGSLAVAGYVAGSLLVSVVAATALMRRAGEPAHVHGEPPASRAHAL
ncbi:MFS transporter [Streptomyces tubercidicus]|uniref:MFS transporter n=1 Tax=Streptomyces tubercidicus TaxID=47759 RepID=UPI00369B9F85